MYGISRQAQDRFAVSSHEKALEAQRAGRFAAEMIPIGVPRRTPGQGESIEQVVQDECVNASPSVEKAAAYPPAFQRDGGTVTAFNACPIADGAAGLLVMSADRARELGLSPQAKIRSYAYAGVPPEIMGLGPAYAIPKALRRAGLSLAQIDLIELNEAFAAQALAVGIELGDLGWDWNRVNVNGGAIALGHPVGCTGTRLVVAMMHALAGRGARLGLVAACVGGGMGGALIIEAMGSEA